MRPQRRATTAPPPLGPQLAFTPICLQSKSISAVCCTPYSALAHPSTALRREVKKGDPSADKVPINWRNNEHNKRQTR